MTRTFLASILSFSCAGLLCAGLLCSCSNDGASDPKTRAEGPVVRPKINAKLQLLRGTKIPEFRAGKEGQILPFRLRNADVKTVTIPDWWSLESYNIALYLAECKKGKALEVPESQFTQVWPLKSDEKKTGSLAVGTLKLTSGGQALLDVPMKILDHYDMKGRPQIFIAVYAKLTSSCADVRSETFELSVRPMTTDVELNELD